jgi:DNA-binding Lrp family transcriptional regulator
LKDIEFKLISELIKNSRRSDRELSKALGVSQPTVSRARTMLEKEGLIEYTAIPNLVGLGYGIIAVVFGKRNYQKEPEIKTEKARDFAKRHPNVIFGADGIGLGYDRIGISIHKNYSDYAQFVREIQAEWGGAMDVTSFLVDLNSEKLVQHFSLKNFAESLKEEKTK